MRAAGQLSPKASRAVVGLFSHAQLWAMGCTLAVDDAPLIEGCKSDEKACDGRCVSLTDPEYGCDAESCQPCVLPNSTSVCDNAGRCAIASCAGNFENCDLSAANGCEVNLDTDVEHCGGCTAPVCEVPGAYAACARGACAIRKCLPGFKDCNRLDVDGCEVEPAARDSGADAGALECSPWSHD